MVAIIYSCPHCGQAKPLVRFGRNRSGTQRLWCKACKRAFTPQPIDRSSVTAQKQQQITGALSERLSQRAIARLLKVSRDTIRKTLKKSRANLPGQKPRGAPAL